MSESGVTWSIAAPVVSFTIRTMPSWAPEMYRRSPRPARTLRGLNGSGRVRAIVRLVTLMTVVWLAPDTPT